MKSTYGLWVTQAEHDEIAATPSTPGADTEPTGTPPVSVPPPSPSTSRTVFLRPPRHRRRWKRRCTTPTARRQETLVRHRYMPGSPGTGLGLTATTTTSPASEASESRRRRSDGPVAARRGRRPQEVDAALRQLPALPDDCRPRRPGGTGQRLYATSQDWWTGWPVTRRSSAH